MPKHTRILLLLVSLWVLPELAPGLGDRPGWAAGPESPPASLANFSPSCPGFQKGGTVSPCTPGTPCINWPPRFKLEGDIFISTKTPAAHARDQILYDYTNTDAPLMKVRFSRCLPLPIGEPQKPGGPLQTPEDTSEPCTSLLRGGKL